MARLGTPRAHAGFLGAAVRLSDEAGIDTDDLLRQNGIETDIRADADASTTVQSLRGFFRDVVREMKDEWFFWNGVITADPGKFGYYGHLAVTAQTLGDAYRNISRNMEKLSSHSIVKIDENEEEIKFLYSVRDDATVPSREVSEAIAAFGIAIARQALGPDWAPQTVFFEHSRPPSITGYRRQCETDYMFDAAGSGLSVKKSDLAASMPGSNIYLQNAIESYIENVLAKHVTTGKTALNVRREIARLLPNAPPTLEEVAHNIGMSARTLQRRLRDSGTSFSDVFEDLRQDLASSMLADRALSISEISYTLGYADTSSFDRAYRSWTGHSPVYTRREQFF